MGAEANVQAVGRAVERWNAHDERYFELYADDLAAHGFPPDVPPTLEGMKGLFRQMWTSFPDARVEVLRAAAEGDVVAAHLRFGGTHEGELMGAAPTGNRIEVELMTFLRFGDDQKVVERWTRMDDVGFMTQLGLMPEPAAAG